jgi:hypothetical protein
MSAKTKNKTRGSSKKTGKASKISCVKCEKTIAAVDQALFVEEEVGRYFCSEPCIVGHFTPEIEKLEREYGKHVSANDLSSEERERFAHLRWMTLENPAEVWKEKVKTGDDRYVLISEFQPEQKAVWAVACCLMLRGDPSFLYLAFVTSDRHLVDVFRRGEQMKIVKNGDDETKIEKLHARVANSSVASEDAEVPETAHLAEPWTEADSVRANLIKSRKASDISPEDFGFYQKCLEESLQDPNELWSYLPKSAKRIYHFLKKYDHDENFWYIVIAKDTTDETQIEIVDAFPTRDEKLVAMCRHGKKEVLGSAANAETAAAADGPIAETARRNVH